MESRGARIGVVVAAVAAVIVLFFVLREQDSTEDAAPVNPIETPQPEPKPERKPPEPENFTAEIEVEGGAPVGGVQELEVPAGEQATITVTSPDTTEHVHLHGYDIFADLAPGQPAKLEFDATIDGVFEMELEDSVTPIAEVTVK